MNKKKSKQLLLFMRLDKKHLESESLLFKLKLLLICVILEWLPLRFNFLIVKIDIT